MKRLILSCLFLWAPQVFSQLQPFEGFVSVTPTRQLYVEYHQATPGYETLVFLNGLTYELSDWNRVTSKLVSEGYGILQLDFRGQGKSLVAEGGIRSELPLSQQVEDLKVVIETLRIKKRVSLVGLSYGGGVGIEFARKFPEMVSDLVLIAPYLRALPNQDAWVRQNIEKVMSIRRYWEGIVPALQMFPISEDWLYDFYLRILVSSLYPVAEPSILKDPRRIEGSFRLAQGIRKFNASRFAPYLRGVNIHMVEALRDEYLPRYLIGEFWDVLPADTKATYLLANSSHKMPQDRPYLLAQWLKALFPFQRELMNPPRKGTYKFNEGIGEFELVPPEKDPNRTSASSKAEPEILTKSKQEGVHGVAKACFRLN